MIHEYAIIGGGITGLAAAHTLQKVLPSGLLFEGSAYGGCIQTKVENGFTLELGANTLVLSPEVASLLEDLGLNDAIEPPAVYPFRQYVFHNGRIEAVPKSPGVLFKTTLFSASEKWRLLRGVFRKLTAPLPPDITIAELFSQLLGEAPVQKLIDPALRGIFGGDITKLNAAAIFPTLVQHIREGRSLIGYAFASAKKGRKLFHLIGGNQILIDALQKNVAAQCVHDRVIDISKKEDGTFLVRTKNGLEFLSKRCIVATSGAATAAFTQSLCPNLAPHLHAIRYAPISVVHAAIPKETPLPEKGFGVLFPSNSDARIIGVLFNSILFPSTAPNNKALITICHGGVSEHGRPLPSIEALIASTREDLRKFFNISSLDILSTYQWQAAIPQFENNFETLQEHFRSCEKNSPGLHFIGVDRGGVGVPERVRWGTSELRSRLGL